MQLERCLCRSVRDADGNKDRKGGLKGITLSSTQVAEWIDSFPISAYISDTLDHCYSPSLSSSTTETPHKEEGVKRCKVDEVERLRISAELGKYSHPLDTESDVLYNIHNSQVYPTMFSVSDSLALDGTMATAFRNTLPTGFHGKFSSPLGPVNTMKHLKRDIRIGDKVVFDLKSIFLSLLVVGQQRDMELLPIFWV